MNRDKYKSSSSSSSRKSSASSSSSKYKNNAAANKNDTYDDPSFYKVTYTKEMMRGLVESAMDSYRDHQRNERSKDDLGYHSDK